MWGWIERQRVISPAFTKRKRQLSPDQYEIVEVRTSRGVLRTALLIPKASEDDADGQVKRGHSNFGTERDAILVRE